MSYVLLILVVAIVATAHVVGKRKGIRSTLDSAIGTGTWVEVRDPVEITAIWGDDPDEIPSGYLGLVISRDKWGRVSLWIAEPWASMWDGRRYVGGVSDLPALRILPPSMVDEEKREEAEDSLVEWLEDVERSRAEYFPEGFWESQGLLDR